MSAPRSGGDGGLGGLPIGGSERDGLGTPWGWLRGFAWFLLAWPLFGLLALGEMEGFDWESILIAMLAPAGIGGVLLLLDRGLTRWFGVSVAVAGQPVPGLLRDLANLALALAVLLGIDLVLVLSFEEKNLFTREELDAGPIAAGLLAGLLTAAVLLRALHRLHRGPPRHEDLGEGWDAAPTVLRILGYLALVPTLLVCTVMIDYTLRSKPDFGPTGWVVLPAILGLGLRSSMARAPRYWARTPWEAWLRSTSLKLPWWIIGWVVWVGTCALLVGAPVVMSDDELTLAGRIITGVLLIPIGGFGIVLALRTTLVAGRQQWRAWRVARRLARNPAALVGWEPSSRPARTAGAAEHGVWLHLADGRRVRFDVDGLDDPLVAWLRAHVPGRVSE